MPEQMSADFEQVMAQCSRGCFTGLLRVRTREGNGEVRFLSGIQDGIRFDTMEGDAALERLLAAREPEFEAISSLPPLEFGSNEPVPPEGSLTRFHAAQLMRYCESNSLTCALELEVDGRVLTARYRLGELLSVEPDSEHTARLAEAKEGLYRFRLPRFELPANVQQRRSAPPAKPAPAPAPAAKPAPAKPAPAPLPAKSPTPASLAETPLVAMKPVAIVTPGAPASAKPPVQAPAAAQPAQSRPAAPQVKPSAPATTQPKPAPAAAARAPEARPAPARPAVSSAPPPMASAPARQADARMSPAAAAPQPRVAEPRAPAAAPPSAPPRSPVPHSPVPRSAPPSGPPSPKPQLDGLWTDAVKPPPQSAPLEFDGSLRPKGAPSPAPAQKQAGRTEGLSSIAYTPPTEAPAVPSQRGKSSARYWLIAILLLLVVAAAGWFVFGR
jgi:hypothetical protein